MTLAILLLLWPLFASLFRRRVAAPAAEVPVRE
jgi:hypothetical protein